MSKHAKKSEKPIVFLDTSALSSVSWAQDAHWWQLLKLGTDNIIELHMSKIALEEWRSRERDKLLSVIETTESNLKRLERKWYGAHLSKNFASFPKFEAFPSFDDVETTANDMADKFIKDHHVFIHDYTEKHCKTVWEKYFSWRLPFIELFGEERMDTPKREARRKHIPDAYIIEAIRDTDDHPVKRYFVVRDKNIEKTLEHDHITIIAVDKINELLEELSGDEPSPPEGASQKDETEDKKRVYDDAQKDEDSGKDKIEIVTEESLTERIQRDFSALDQTLTKRILAYTSQFDEIDKDDLIKLLERKGHHKSEILYFSQKLSSSNYIQDLGTSFAVKNSIACAEARREFEDELIEIISGDGDDK